MSETRDDRGAGERHELAELRALKEDLGALPTEARVPEDLWSGIRARLGVADPKVVELAPARTGGGERITVSLWQLVAAGVVLALLSGGGVWLALEGGDAVGTPRAVLSAVPATPATDQGRVSATTVQEYQDAVMDLEKILDEGRRILGQETIRTIEESLATIDDAIDEARSALDADPRSEVLNRLLARNMWKKIEILRQTAVAIRARTT